MRRCWRKKDSITISIRPSGHKGPCLASCGFKGWARWKQNISRHAFAALRHVAVLNSMRCISLSTDGLEAPAFRFVLSSHPMRTLVSSAAEAGLWQMGEKRYKKVKKGDMWDGKFVCFGFRRDAAWE